MAPKKSTRRRGTLKDVSALAGVSVNTCSAVLNPRSVEIAVREETRRKVEEAARKVDYQLNVAASKLAGGPAKTLGILLDRIDNFFWGPVLSAFEAEAVARGYQCLIGCTRYEGPRRAECLKRFIEHGVDGLLLTTVWDDPGVEEAVVWGWESDPAVVFVDMALPGYPAPLVCGNHRQGGTLLAEHLISEGHRSLAYLCPRDGLHQESTKERIEGIRQAIRQGPHDMTPLQLMASESEDCPSLAQIALAKMASETPPSAIMVATDAIAYSLLLGLEQHGCRVPEDIAVTGYDGLNNFAVSFLDLPQGTPFLSGTLLTTIRQPLEEIGRTASSLLIELLEAERPRRKETHALDVELIVGDSSRLPVRCR